MTQAGKLLVFQTAKGRMGWQRGHPAPKPALVHEDALRPQSKAEPDKGWYVGHFTVPRDALRVVPEDIASEIEALRAERARINERIDGLAQRAMILGAVYERTEG